MSQPEEVHSEFERRLHAQYREAAREMPPELDRRILDAARAAAPAANERKEPAFGAGVVPGGGPSSAFAADVNDAPRQRRDEQRWMKPLALAAAVVLAVGVVVHVRNQRPDLGMSAGADSAGSTQVASNDAPAPASAVPGPAAAPAPAAPAAAAPPPPPAAVAAASTPAPAEAVAEKRVAQAPVQDRTVARVEPEERPKARAEAAPARRVAAAEASSGTRMDKDMREQLAREEAQARIRESADRELRKLDVPAGAPAGTAPAASALASAPPAKPAAVPAPAAPAAVAGALGADANSSARTRAAPFYEGDPDLWVRQIISMRRSGHDGSADAELKRMRARYPDYKVPAEALAPKVE